VEQGQFNVLSHFTSDFCGAFLFPFFELVNMDSTGTNIPRTAKALKDSILIRRKVTKLKNFQKKGSISEKKSATG